MTLTIGLTGGIGSGKSTVAKIFGELDVPVFDTDLIARELVVPGSSAATEIRKIFGDGGSFRVTGSHEEKNWQDVVDRILVVDLAKDEQLKRASSRDNVSETLVSQIVRTQAGRDKRLSYANDIIDNNGSLESLTSQVNELHKKYLSLSKQK